MENIIKTELYITEAEESKLKSKRELEIPDPVYSLESMLKDDETTSESNGKRGSKDNRRSS